MSTYKKICGSLVLLVVALLFLTFIIPVSFIPYDNWMFNSFSEQLFTLSAPKSSVVETKLEYGSLAGNGDHCDIFATVLLKSDVTENDLNNYYRLYIQLNHPTEPLPQVYKVSDFSGKIDSLNHLLLPVQTYAKDVQSRFSKDDLSKYYIVYIYAPDYVSGIGDLRCG
jgi:hypothetical protein